MVDDHVGHHLDVLGERADVVPRSQTFIYLGVVDGVEACIAAVDRVKEGQEVDAAKNTMKRPLQQCIQLRKSTTGQAVYIGHELNLVLHALPSRAGVLINNTATAATASKHPARRMTLSGRPPSTLSYSSGSVTIWINMGMTMKMLKMPM